MLNTPTSNYYTVQKINKSLTNAGTKGLSIFHCNIRSLPKNIGLLNDMLYTMSKKIDIVALTETRLNVNSTANIDIIGYNFFIMIQTLLQEVLGYM